MKWIANHKITVALLLLLAAGFALLGWALMAPAKPQPATVVVYESPVLMQPYADVTLTVADTPVFVAQTAVSHNRAFSQTPPLASAGVASFDMDGSVTVSLSADDLHSLVVRPLSLGIEPNISGNTASFTLSEPAQLTLEINGEPTRAVHLFANPLETDVPDPDDETVIYFGPGLHKTGIFTVDSNTTVYLAGGAVVQGGILARNAENITIKGRGFFDGSVYDRWNETTVPLNLQYCSNVTVEGIGFLDPAGWTLNGYFCTDLTVDNVKIITARSNGDGITLQSCKDVAVTNSFVRSWDDSLVVKNYDGGSTRNILFDNMVVWTDLAQSCEVGYETNGPAMKNITFQNITVLHNYHKPVMSIHNSDNAAITNVTFKDIVVEDAQMGDGDGAAYLMEMTIASSQWSSTVKRGTISDVRFENITVLDGKVPGSNFIGYSADHGISNVSIENLVIHGQRITSLQQGSIKALLYVDTVTIDGEIQEVGAK